MPGFQREGALIMGRSDGIARRFRIRTYNDQVPSSNYTAFDVHDGTIGSDGRTVMMLRGNGNVGIGTTNPQSALAVNGTVNATAFAGDGSQLTGIAALGTVVKITSYVNATRIVTSAAAERTIETFSITKTQSGTALIIQAVIPTQAYTNANGYNFVAINGVYSYSGISYAAQTASDVGIIVINQVRTGIGSGTVSVAWGWSSADSTSNRPYNVINPNSTDGTRLRQNATSFTISEVTL